MLPYVAQCCLMLPNVTQCCRILPNVAVCYPMLPNVTQCCPMLPNVVVSCPMFPNVTQCCPMLPCFTQCCPMLPYVTLCCQTNFIFNSCGQRASYLLNITGQDGVMFDNYTKLRGHNKTMRRLVIKTTKSPLIRCILFIENNLH